MFTKNSLNKIKKADLVQMYLDLQAKDYDEKMEQTLEKCCNKAVDDVIEGLKQQIEDLEENLEEAFDKGWETGKSDTHDEIDLAVAAHICEIEALKKEIKILTGVNKKYLEKMNTVEKSRSGIHQNKLLKEIEDLKKEIESLKSEDDQMENTLASLNFYKECNEGLKKEINELKEENNDMMKKVIVHVLQEESLHEVCVDLKKRIEDIEGEESEEQEYKIEINVVGLGFCRYIDEEDRDKKVVYCKNDCWKIRGDKTAKDEEGNYCETDEEED